MLIHWLKQKRSIFQDGKDGDRFSKNHSDHLIELHQVAKTYQTPAGNLTVLNNIDLRVATNEFVAVVGKSGSGKTTLINMITGIDRPTRGEVLVDGLAIHLVGEDQLAFWRGRNVGIVFQFFQLLPTLTAVENVMLPMEFCNRLSPRERLDRALSLLESVDLADQAYQLPAQLSGGEQQRTAIARALVNDPRLLVADEPTGNVDSKTGDKIFELFENLVRKGKTILMVTHDLELASRASRTIHLSNGRLIV